ncbi:MAG TPA: hypothetical protein VM779_10600 [Thermoanaerobaculia bacterium]|nr:hypothetical protein [Thermoanaerobaculia bacterium]
MIELTPTARERFDAYLSRLRSALRGTPQVEAEEVEQNVREHIEVALGGVPAPVGAEHLGAVLDRLGPPERWIADDEQSAWKRAINRLRSGPEDWRLAYLSFALFAASFLFLPIGGVLLLIPAFVVSRAAVSLLAEKGDPIGARRWLIYPAIATVMVILLVPVLVGPPAGIVAWSIEEKGLYRASGLDRDELLLAERVQLETGLVMAVFGAWWMIAAAILAAAYRPLQIAFRPILDRWRRRHLAVLALVGAIIAAIGATVFYVTW